MELRVPLGQVSHTTVRNKHVRYRACQLVAEILERLTEEISEDLWDELKVALLARLRDKMVPVRMQAARALSRLQVRAHKRRFVSQQFKTIFCTSGARWRTPSTGFLNVSLLPTQEPVEEGSDISSDPVVTAYIQSLSWERSKDVRKVVLGSLVVADGTLSAVVDRTCDSHAEVRRVVFMVLAAKAELCHLSIVQRNSILRCGFADRDPKARQACMDLLVTWFRGECTSTVHPSLFELTSNPCEFQSARLALLRLRGASGLAWQRATATPWSCCTNWMWSPMR
jgi:condensin complex subunit 3